MNSAWQYCQSVHARNDSRIDSLKTQHDDAFENMKSAGADSQAAFHRGDHAGAKCYSARKEACRSEAKNCVTERRALVAECKAAGEQVKATKPAFERAQRLILPALSKLTNEPKPHTKRRKPNLSRPRFALMKPKKLSKVA